MRALMLSLAGTRACVRGRVRARARVSMCMCLLKRARVGAHSCALEGAGALEGAESGYLWACVRARIWMYDLLYLTI